MFIVTACTQGQLPDLLSDAPPSIGRDAYVDALSTGNYAAGEEAIELLTREYLDGDPHSTALLGFAHAWRLSEASRSDDASARVIESADLAVRFFSEALEDFPNDRRLRGFLGSFKQAQGSIHDRPALQRKGWFDQKAAVRDWPEWEHFTQAYGRVTKGVDDPRYVDGIDLLWKNLEACIDDRIDRNAFNYRPLFDLVQSDSDDRDQRACVNTPIAPYNALGFFLFFREMLAKARDLATADGMYQTALDLPESETWPYVWLAEDRIANLDVLPDRFGRAP